MAGEETIKRIKDIVSPDQNNVNIQNNVATVGLNMDQSVNQLQKGQLTYALNAALENFDGNAVNYQNEQGNELCFDFPENYQLIGKYFIPEKNKHIFFLTNPIDGNSQIGYMDNNDCIYRIYIQAPCLNFNIDHPIHKVAHKITNCSTEIYWTDGYNPRRYLNLEDIPYLILPGSSLCDPIYLNEVDCNQLKIQPNFSIPSLEVVDVVIGGNLISGTYQFAIQYCDAVGNPFTSYYSVTNPTPIANTQLTTPDFNYQVGKSIVVNVSGLDVTGQFEYFNLAVIKTVNAITSVELAGTYFIETPQRAITYTGQNVTQARLSTDDIFEKFPYYDIAQDLTTAQDVLIWDQLTSIDRINYQQIANQITLQWESFRIPATENYADEINATNLRGYLRDEVYAFEIVFLLKNGKQTDGFHIPGRIKGPNENRPDVPDTNPDFIGEGPSAPYWKIYNTASVTGFSSGYSSDPTYKGPYQYGEFAYWESEEEYPCNKDLWGDLAGQKIRHHKFPDVLVSPVFESALFTTSQQMVMQNDAVFPIGVRIDNTQVQVLISTSNLTNEQKDDIIGFKIVRGDRSTNKSIVAKGILRNVNTYERDKQTYLFPNYPYNDLTRDPFLTKTSNAYLAQCKSYTINPDVVQYSVNQIPTTVEYTDCNTNKKGTATSDKDNPFTVCSVTKPVVTAGLATIDVGGSSIIVEYTLTGQPIFAVYNIYFVESQDANSWQVKYYDYALGEQTLTVQGLGSPTCCTYYYLKVDPTKGPPVKSGGSSSNYSITFVGSSTTGQNCANDTPLPTPKEQPELAYRHIFNSPETSFAQPFLGNVLKLENAIFGRGKAHFVQVKKNAMYKLLTKEAQEDALNSAANLGNITGTFSAAAMFTAYQSYLTIYINGITRRNYAYSFNSIASYDYHAPIQNDLGVKQRMLDIAQYIIPGVQNVGDIHNVNNWNRESSVYLRTDLAKSALPYPDMTPSIYNGSTSSVIDRSRFTISEKGVCDAPGKEQDISVLSYYASIKTISPSQWGQMYSYETIDTGYQVKFDTTPQYSIAFGGDTFISRFTFKTKLPFFIDNRVGAPDDSDIFYDEIGNVAYPRYWHSARSILSDYTVPYGTLPVLSNIISYKAHNFDCPNSQTPAQNNQNRTFYDGYFYLFAYGVPNFYCESSYNTDLRQAFNNKEGDFWPHVSTGIPDDWVQESFVSIANDNTYYYNVSYSKQNRENTFTHLPPNWQNELCYTHYPFRAIYSDKQDQNVDNRVNKWLVYRPVSFYDFPQNYGNLTSLDGIQNRAVLARFENKTLLYNNLLTIDTSNPQAAYIGNDKLFASAPPIDFAETDLGYVGSQHKFLLKIPQGQITVDAKRGQVFLISGTEVQDLSAFGSGMNRFFTDFLSFEILRHFPKVNIDNHFKGLGLHGVYDSKFDRVIITKLDYIPLDKNIVYDEATQEFYLNNEIVQLRDDIYFCNRSWTISFDVDTRTWVSFHSYLPNWYIAENNFFYSGLNDCCADFDATVGVLVAQPTTTTTSSTTNTTSSTTTIAPPDCRLLGFAQTINCTLQGTAVQLNITTTTTSTSSTSTTTSTSTSTTTTTTTIPPCRSYTATKKSTFVSSDSIVWTDCFGQYQLATLYFPGGPGEPNSITFCARQGSLVYNASEIDVVDNGPCTPPSTTTTSTSSSTSTSTSSSTTSSSTTGVPPVCPCNCCAATLTGTDNWLYTDCYGEMQESGGTVDSYLICVNTGINPETGLPYVYYFGTLTVQWLGCCSS